MTISSNQPLSLDEMKINAQYIMDKFIAKGWTSNAICGMLGNMQSESTINPGRWESSQEYNMNGGFGLVQWTPATKYTDWADLNNYEWTSIDGQIERIEYERQNNLQFSATATDSYPMTFTEFSQSTDSAYNLGLVFLANYEKPLNPDQPERGTQADYWYNELLPTPVTKRKMPLYFYLRRV